MDRSDVEGLGWSWGLGSLNDIPNIVRPKDSVAAQLAGVGVCSSAAPVGAGHEVSAEGHLEAEPDPPAEDQPAVLDRSLDLDEAVGPCLRAIEEHLV